MKLIVALLLLLPALAGCTQTDASFDGEATLAWVEDIVYDGDDLRALVPGHAGHADAASWLQEQLTVDGWNVRQDSFTGADYEPLDKGAVAVYATGASYCKSDDRDELPDLEFFNLYATLPGTSSTHQVVLAAHWDGKEDARDGGAVPAANDGASGVATLLQLQRHMAQHQITLPFDLTIALFDGEDGFQDCHPLAGSIWAARTEALGDISQLILLDMVGDEDARFIRDRASTTSDPQLVDAIWEIAPDFRLEDNFSDCAGPMLDDHIPFTEEGISAIDIIDAGRGAENSCIQFPPYWHTSQDTPDKLSAQMLGKMGDLVTHILTDDNMQALLQD